MRSIIIFTACLIILSCSKCQQGKTVHQLTMEADSLITLSLSLQQLISSPEVQRFHEFQAEINQDFVMLPGINNEQVDGPVKQYKDLQRELGHCIQLCVHYHEEAFILETTLREIKVLSEREDADLEQLRELLDNEISMYENLAIRIDSSLKMANIQAKTFYSLKPEIDKIITRVNQTSNPMP